MSEPTLNSNSRFIKVALILAVSFTLTNCRTLSSKMVAVKNSGEITTIVNNNNTPPGEIKPPLPPPTLDPTKSPIPPKPEDKIGSDGRGSKPEQDFLTASAVGRQAEAWVIPSGGGKNYIGQTPITTKVQVGTNRTGLAVVTIKPNCGTFTVFHDTELRFSPCSISAIASGGPCLNNGTLNFDGTHQNCRRNRIRMGTNGIEIDLDARNDVNHPVLLSYKNTGFVNATSQINKVKTTGNTVFDLFYFRGEKLSFVRVRLGQIIVRPVGDIGASILLTKDKCYLTQQGVSADIERVEQRRAVACEENYIPLLLEAARRENNVAVTVGNIQLSNDLALKKLIPLLPSDEHPVIKFYPARLEFADGQLVGQQIIKNLSIENRGKREPINISQPTISGVNSSDFALLSDNCSTRTFEDKCEMQIGFTPGDLGNREGVLSIKARSETLTVRLEGFGIRPSPPINLIIDRATSVPLFPSYQKVGTKTTNSLNIKNTGTVSVKDVKVSIEGVGEKAFTYVNNCVGEIAPNGTCDVEVSFTPQSEDQFVAKLSISATEANPTVGPARTFTLSPVELKSTGAKPDIKLNQTELCFSEQIVVKKKDERILLVTNTSTVPLTVGKASVTSGDFSITDDTCSNKEVAGGAECHVTVGFSPSKTGLREGILTIEHDSKKTSPYVVKLKGVGKSDNAFIRFLESIFKRRKNPCKKD